MKGVFCEVDRMLSRGRLDLPLTLSAAVSRGDDLLLHQLLKHGLEPNECDHNMRTPLHIAASEGNDNCVRLLLDHGADPNSRDNEGNTPLWEAMLRKHANVIKLLADNGAVLSAGDAGNFACVAAERNDVELLRQIVRLGGDVTVPQRGRDRNTALHVAVSEGNVDTVKFLLQQRADADRTNVHGWTPRALADQQGHHDILALFHDQNRRCEDSDGACSATDSSCDVRSMLLGGRKGGSYHNSLFGIVTSASGGNRNGAVRGVGPARVTVCCPEKAVAGRKLVLLPASLDELLAIGTTKFGFAPTKVLTLDRAEIDEVELIRDGDHLLLVSDDWDGEVCDNDTKFVDWRM